MSSNNWTILTDPSSGRQYYYNTATQATQWEAPAEFSSKPTFGPSDTWFELVHEAQGRFFYFNKALGQVSWEKPASGLVVSFNQKLPAKPAIPTVPNSPVTSTPSIPVIKPITPVPVIPISPVASTPVIPTSPVKPAIPATSSTSTTQTPIIQSPVKPSIAASDAPLDALAIGWEEYTDQASGRKYYVNRVSGKTTWERSEAVEKGVKQSLVANRLQTPVGLEFGIGLNPSSGVSSSQSMRLPNAANPSFRATVGGVSSFANQPRGVPVGHLSVNGPIDPALIFPEGHRSLPKPLMVDINKFQESEFAKRHFLDRKQGLFRKALSAQQMMTFSKELLEHPLLKLSKGVDKLALKCFKKIMKFMGDYPCKSQEREGQMLINFGLTNVELRDEIYCQIAKQLIDNPNEESAVRGWGLMGLTLSFYQPSTELIGHLREICNAHMTGPHERIAACARFVNTRLGLQGFSDKKVVTPTDVSRCPELPRKPNYFNCTITELLYAQGDKDNPSAIPKILVKLAEGLLKYNGAKTEGIFRIAANTEVIEDIKSRLMAGNDDLSSITDPHIYAVLMKQFLRTLVIPTIPHQNYDSCLKNCRDPERSVQVVSELPQDHAATLVYLIRFLQHIAHPENQKFSKMDSRNLAVVLSPNILKCLDNDPQVVFRKTQDEAVFIQNLIERYPGA